MSSALGAPVSRTGATSMPRVQVTPWKAFARAAIFLALAVLAALALRGYIPHRPFAHAEESVSLPARRVTQTFSPATPVPHMAVDTKVSLTTPLTTAMARWNGTQSVPESYNADARPPATNLVEYASTKKTAVVPALTILDPPASLQTRTNAPVTASHVSLPPSAINSPTRGATPQVELASQSASKKSIAHEVRRAEPAEPDHPEKKPAAVAPNTTPPVSPQTNSAIKAEEARRDATGRSRKIRRPDPEPAIPPKVPH